SRRRQTSTKRDWSSDVCSSDLNHLNNGNIFPIRQIGWGCDFPLVDIQWTGCTYAYPLQLMHRNVIGLDQLIDFSINLFDDRFWTCCCVCLNFDLICNLSSLINNCNSSFCTPNINTY